MTTVERSSASFLVWVRLTLLSAALFTVGTNSFVIAGVLPEIAESLRVTPVEAGYSITAYAAVVAVASPVVSIVFARVPRGLLMASGLFVIAGGTALAVSADSIGTFLAGRVLAALGGAALVPAATAAAPALLPPQQRGRALSVIALGLTLATAAGSPAGTALAASGGWRLPLGVLAVLAAVLGVAVLLSVRAVPVGAPASFRARLAPLADPRLLLDLAAAMLLVASLNSVYLYLSLISRPVTGGDPAVLALVLAVFGIAGVIGAASSGTATDRWGSRRVGATTMAMTALAFALYPVADGLLWTALAGYAVGGLTTAGAIIPLQLRIVQIDPASAPIALSWFSTATYVGIAVAPVIGGATIGFGASAVPVAAAVLAALALGVFLAGFAVRRRPAAA